VKEVFIVNAGINTSLGDSLADTGKNLYQGKSGIRPIEYFDVGKIDFKLAAWKERIKKEPGRMEQTNRICVLMQPVLDALQTVPENTYIIWCGIKGNVELIEHLAEGAEVGAGQEKPGASCLGPHLAADYRVWVGDYLHLAGSGLEVNAACASSTLGIIYGSQLIARGICQSVLVCAADLVSRFTHMGFAALKALSLTVARPFDTGRDGLNLGDGAVAILLTDRERAKKLGTAEVYQVKGWAMANDANHITGPARDGCGLIEAINRTLERAGMQPGDVAAFCAHGTGTVYNDAMELAAVDAVFGKRQFPIFSVKGALGHTLGAAGGIEAALCCLALKEGRVPPTAGLQHPEERAAGKVLAIEQPLQGRSILTTNSGFGGINASLLISAGPV
jgi:3-oxoacyl-[acyl-carrier-protein] synthase II